MRWVPSSVAASIDVVVAADEAEVVLGVRDRGPGMSEADRGRATDRFWRAPGAALFEQIPAERLCVEFPNCPGD